MEIKIRVLSPRINCVLALNFGVTLCICTTGLIVEIISPQAGLATGSITALPITGPAMDLAVADVNERYASKFQVRLTYLNDLRVKTCDDYVAASDYVAADYFYRRATANTLPVFIFPGSCTRETIPLVQLTAAWNQLTILAVFTHAIFRNRVFYPNVLQFGPSSVSQVGDAVTAFVLKYNWRTVYVVSDTSGPGFTLAIQGALAFADKMRTMAECTLYLETIDSAMGNRTEPIDGILLDIGKVARVISFFGHATSLRRFMIQAYYQNMTSSEYVYVFLDAYEYPTWTTGNCTWQNNDDDDPAAFRAFEALFVLSPTVMTKDRRAKEQLRKELADRSSRDYNYTYRNGFGPTPAVLGSYGAVSVLGQVLDSLLQSNRSGMNLSDATALIVQQISGHSFSTKAGTFLFDALGERQILYGIRQLNVSTGILELVLTQRMGHQKAFMDIAEIRWRENGRPPPDKPACGFSGFTGTCSVQNALVDPKLLTAILCVVAVVILLLPVAFCIFVRKGTLRVDRLDFGRFDVTLDLALQERVTRTKSVMPDRSLFGNTNVRSISSSILR